MLNAAEIPDAATLEQCVDAIDGFIDTLGHYSAQVLVFAMRVHLVALLRAMAEERTCTREEVRAFVVGLECEALGVGGE